MLTPDDHRNLVRRLNGIWDGNLDVIDELVAEEFVNHNPLVPDAPAGREGFRRNVTAFLDAFPDIGFALEDIIAEGDRVVFRSTGSGTHEGEFMGIAPTGNEITFSVIVIFRIEDGQIAERWAQSDSLGVLQQLGVIPTPGDATDA